MFIRRKTMVNESLFSLNIKFFQGIFSKKFIKKNNISSVFNIEKDKSCSKKAKGKIFDKKRMMYEAKNKTVRISTRGNIKKFAKIAK
jgi:hypothetical protein